jgi:hypothetical protein
VVVCACVLVCLKLYGLQGVGLCIPVCFATVCKQRVVNDGADYAAYQPFLSSTLGGNNAHNERSCWPVSLGQEFSPWASVQAGNISDTKSTAHDLTQLEGL